MSSDPTDIPGEPGGLIGLGTQLLTSADGVGSVAGRVTSNGLPDWSGAAGEAFRSSLQTFPGEMGHVKSALESAGHKVRSFGQDLENYQHVARTKAQQIAQNNVDQQSAQFRADAAKTKVDAAAAARDAAADPVSLKTAHKVLDSAMDLFHTAGSAVDTLVAEGEKLAADALANFKLYRQAVEDVIGHIEGAVPDIVAFMGRAGAHVEHLAGELDHFVGSKIQEGERKVKHAAGEAESGLKRAWHDTTKFGHVMETALATGGKVVWHVAKDVGTGVVHAAERIPGDAMKIYHDPANLRDWSQLAQDTGTVAGGVALATAAIVLLPEEGAAGVVAAGAATVGETAGAAVTLSLGVQTEADVGSVAEGQGSAASLAGDALDIGLTEVHVPGLRQADHNVENLTNRADGLENYSLNRQLGATHSQALSALDTEQRKVISDGAKALSTTEKRDVARSGAQDALSAAEKAKRPLDLMDEAGHQLVLDPIKDAVAEQVKDETQPSAPQPSETH